MDAGASPCPHSHFSSWGTKGRVPHGARPFVVLRSLVRYPPLLYIAYMMLKNSFVDNMNKDYHFFI